MRIAICSKDAKPRARTCNHWARVLRREDTGSREGCRKKHGQLVQLLVSSDLRCRSPPALLAFSDPSFLDDCDDEVFARELNVLNNFTSLCAGYRAALMIDFPRDLFVTWTRGKILHEWPDIMKLSFETVRAA